MSKNLGFKWGELVAQLIGISCVAVVLLCIWPGWTRVVELFSHNAAPAWVQAVGSIVAIFTAIGVALWQRVATQKSQIERERAEFLIERKKCSFLISSLGGVIVAMGNRFQPGKGESVWDARMSRIYMHSELERSKEISIHALTKAEMEFVFELRLIGMQLLEVLIDAESSGFPNAEKKLIVKEEKFLFLLETLNFVMPRAKNALDELKINWEKNNDLL